MQSRRRSLQRSTAQDGIRNVFTGDGDDSRPDIAKWSSNGGAIIERERVDSDVFSADESDLFKEENFAGINVDSEAGIRMFRSTLTPNKRKVIIIQHANNGRRHQMQDRAMFACAPYHFGIFYQTPKPHSLV